jgi:putative endonuclease
VGRWSIYKNKSKYNLRAQGKIGEEQAARYLEHNGFKILERNYRFESGEIDLIAEEGEELVFIEVKARRSKKFGLPEEAVNEDKQEKIQAAAEGYLYERDIDDRACRFDVIAIEYENDEAVIRHIRDAF